MIRDITIKPSEIVITIDNLSIENPYWYDDDIEDCIGDLDYALQAMEKNHKNLQISGYTLTHVKCHVTIEIHQSYYGNQKEAFKLLILSFNEMLAAEKDGGRAIINTVIDIEEERKDDYEDEEGCEEDSDEYKEYEILRPFLSIASPWISYQAVDVITEAVIENHDDEITAWMLEYKRKHGKFADIDG